MFSPEKLTTGLNWLKANNPLYADVNVNEHWVDESEANDSDVFHGLVRQPSKIPQEHTQEDSTNHSEPMDCEPSLTGGSTPRKTVQTTVSLWTVSLWTVSLA